MLVLLREYDEVKNAVSPVLVDTAGILNFSTDYLITGINVIDKFFVLDRRSD